MIRILLITIALLTTSFDGYAQQSKYNFKFQVEGVKDATIFLARYFGEQLFYSDTTTCDANGAFSFHKEEHLGGVYAVVVPDGKPDSTGKEGVTFFEVILTEEEVDLKTTSKDFIGDMIVNKSKENDIFYGYYHFIKGQTDKAAESRQVLKTVNKTKEPKVFKKAKDYLTELDQQVKDYQRKLAIDNKGMFIAQVIGMSIEPVIPEVPDSAAKDFRYQYYKSHYFEFTDFTDKRIVHTPVFSKKFKRYFDQVLVKHPDTIFKEAVNIIDQIEPGSDLFKFVVNHISYSYETSNIMGMDEVFVRMALKYFCKDKNGVSPAFWWDDDKNKEICERAHELLPLIVDTIAPNIILMDTTEKNWVNMHQVKADYTILVFWDAGCGHCKKEIPKLQKLMDELRGRDDYEFQIIGINTELENDAWRKYLKDQNIKDWIHISDNPEINKNHINILRDGTTTLESLNFRQTYDIFSTPQIYLLDKDKVIKAKKLNAKTLSVILEQMLEIEIEYDPPVDNHKEGDDDDDAH